ncbi:hypothetical protein KJ628_04295 [Patescibacteria group bacterium]|nr:hypothetical protein [Patescibacteria group bacterium]
MFWKKFAAIFLSIFFLSLVIATSAQAQTDSDYFDTKLHTTVTVNETGSSRIKHEFIIANKTPTTYISQYGLKISSADLKNITIVSDGKAVEPEIVSTKAGQQSGPGQTSIGITFPDKIVGEGKTRKFTISYTNPNAAVISGSVLEVTLPPQANPQDYSSYRITLITPDKFGGPIRTTPKNLTFTAQGNQVITSFDRGGERGTFALFGSIQLFDLDLSYHLNNPTNNPGITQIALPPDTTFQKMHYHQLDPRPEKIELDADGNWIATYQLPASTDTVVNLNATVLLTLEPNLKIPIPKPTQSLLESQDYWPVNHPDIKELAQKYTTAKDINDFVVNTLSYNTAMAFNAPERLGAIEALNNPDQVVCQEFTDLFVTLARSAGVYSRRATGYAHSQNSELRPLSLVEDILHSWPEYFDPAQQRWIPIDPTWENTTGGVDYFHQLDLNHIVFAINGQNSITPHPAGSYKEQDSAQKTVYVEFGTHFPEEKLSFVFNLTPQKILGINIPGRYLLQISNNIGQAYYHLPLNIQTSTTNLVIKNNPKEITALLPFQTIEIPLVFENNSSWLPIHDTIELKIADDFQKFNITTSPQLQLNLSFYQEHYYLVMAGGAIFVTLIAGSLLVFRRKK